MLNKKQLVLNIIFASAVVLLGLIIGKVIREYKADPHATIMRYGFLIESLDLF